MRRWWDRVRVILRPMVWRRRAESELDEEFRYHVEREIAERVAAGQEAVPARRDALRMMGPIERNREECRDLRRRSDIVELAGVAWRDASYGARLFRRHPMPLGIAVAGLALAIAVVSALVSVVNAALLRPYGMDDPASVVRVGRVGQPAWIGWTYPQYLEMRRSKALAAIEAAADDRVRVSPAAIADETPARPVLFVSGGYMAVLGGRPRLGRTLLPSDDVAGAPPVAVISHHLWRVAYQSDATVIGSEMRLNGTPVTIVGVMDPAFTGPVSTPRVVWVPLALHGPVTGADAWGPTTGPRVEVVARLRSDVDPEAAAESLMALTQPADSGAQPSSQARRPIVLYSAASPISGFVDEETYYGLAAVAVLALLVLALACANAANLLMASAATRRREIGVRVALGATRRRLIGQLMTESAMLALLAGGVGVLLAYAIAPHFGALAQVDPGVTVTPDARVVMFTAVLALVCGLSTSLLPARRSTRTPVLANLQGAGQGRRTTGLPWRLRSFFVGFQAAIAVLLLIVAALLTRTAVLTSHLDMGFDVDRLVGVSFGGPTSNFDQDAYLAVARTTIESLTGVEAVSVTQHLPFAGPTVERERLTHDGRSFVLNITRADGSWFRTAGVDVVRGRSFTQEEVDREVPVALISESTGRAFFGEMDPLGQPLSFLPTEAGGRLAPATIVGVVADARLSFSDSQEYGGVVVPLKRQRTSFASLLVRTSTPVATSRAIEDALRGSDPRVRVDSRVVQEALGSYIESRNRIAWMVAPGALLALALAVLGIFAVTTFVVGQRIEEVSVRMAFGASSWDVVRLLTGDALRPVLIGVSIGVLAAYVVGRILTSLLAEISPHDPLSIGGAVLLLVVSAVVAVLLPASRAAHTSPATLIRRA